MVVIALVAVAAGVVSLSLRDGDQARLEHEAVRLATLLETARTEARAAGLAVRWMPTPESADHAFRFVGLPEARHLPTRWADPAVIARVPAVPGALVLGPEPLIGAQRVTLQLAQHRLDVATDGLRPFTVQPTPGSAAAP